MGILLIDNINRWKKKDSGKQFGLLCDKAETGKIKILRMLHSILAFILEFRRKDFTFTDNGCLCIQFQKITQSPRMVTVTVG